VVDISNVTPPTIKQQWFGVNGKSYLGEKMEMRGVCIHETGNTSAGAEAQQNVNYMNSVECINRQASWHATVGLSEIIQTIPADRQAYHASDGDGPGNTHFYAIEGVMCYPVGTSNFRRVMMNHAWYAARMLKENGLALSFNRGANGSLAQHNDFARDHKDCPQFYRDNGLWGEFCDLVSAFFYAEDAPAIDDPSVAGWGPEGNPFGDFKFVNGFYWEVRNYGQVKYPADWQLGAFAHYGYPKENERATDLGSEQKCERYTLQWQRGANPPWDIVGALRED
jgi:hypothetical protein